jgi:hypothetical protein
MRKTLIILAMLAVVSFASTVGALPITFNSPGTLHIKFISEEADYNDYFGIASPFSQALGMNHMTVAGYEWDLGHIDSMVPIVLNLHAYDGTTHLSDFVSNPVSGNLDGLEHIKITQLGEVKRIGWEDIYGPGRGDQTLPGDEDYNDVVLDVWVVPDPIPTPEFPTMAFPVALIMGMLGAVLLIQKTKEN